MTFSRSRLFDMNIQAKLILMVATTSVAIATIGLVLQYQLERVTEPFEQSIPRGIENLDHAARLNDLAQSIRYYDEVLTQSARNYAFTEDKKWEERYRAAEPELDGVIKQAIAEGDDIEKTFFARVDDANLALVEMEYASIDLVNSGRAQEAIQILESQEYADNKLLYYQGLQDYLTTRGFAYQSETDAAASALTLANEIDARGQELLQQTTTIMMIIIPSAIGVTALIGFRLYHSINAPLQKLVGATDALAKGDYTASIGTLTHDEIGVLAYRFEKTRRELQDKERIKDEFINIASHELKNPIQPILLFADLAKHGDVEAKVALDVILKQATRLQQLASDILDASKIDAGSMKLHKKEAMIGDLLENIVNPLKPSLKPGLALDLDVDENTPMEIDPSKISQVVTNIVQNALKFTESGSITVRKRTLVPNGGEKPRMVEITISDTGKGIPADLLPNLFGKFVTKDIDGRNKSGTGLGLYISKGIVKAHGGDLTAYNNPEGGASFRILLPQSAQATAPAS